MFVICGIECRTCLCRVIVNCREVEVVAVANAPGGHHLRMGCPCCGDRIVTAIDDELAEELVVAGAQYEPCWTSPDLLEMLGITVAFGPLTPAEVETTCKSLTDDNALAAELATGDARPPRPQRPA